LHQVFYGVFAEASLSLLAMRFELMIRIEVSGNLEDGTAIYQFSDYGISFNLQYSSKLFQPFQRLHTRRSLKKQPSDWPLATLSSRSMDERFGRKATLTKVLLLLLFARRKQISMQHPVFFFGTEKPALKTYTLNPFLMP
jgi:hypothetical protein